MRLRIRPLPFFLLLATAIVLGTFAVHRHVHNLVRTDDELVSLLPTAPDSTIAFVSIRALREARVANLLSAAEPASESDYHDFVAATGFDYTRDLDALALEDTADRITLIGRGRFDWDRIAEYVKRGGGACSSFCSGRTSTGRWASLRPLASDVIAVVVSESPDAIQSLGKKKSGRNSNPDAPLWVSFLPGTLDPNRLPFAFRAAMLPFASAQRITALVRPHLGTSLELEMRGTFRDGSSPERCRRQLELETSMLKLKLASEHRVASRSDLNGSLVNGSFQIIGQDVIAKWPIYPELLATFR